MELRLADPRHAQATIGQALRVSAIYARALIEAVEAAGVPLEALSRAAGLPPEQFANPYAWIEVAELDRLVSCAIELTGDPAFGLHWCERSPMMKFELFAMVTACAPTLREALACLLRFQPILTERPELELVERADSTIMRFVPLATTELGLRVRTELGVFGLVRLMRHVGAPAGAVRRIAFAHRAPPYVQEYERLFDGRARFAQAYSGIEVDSAWLDRHVHNTNHELHQLLTIEAQQVLSRVRSASGYGGQVRAYLRRQFPRLPEMREAARALALSERSLRRRLAEEGLSYSAILQESQLLLARQLLGDPTRSIQQVAFEIGFTSTTAFHRAFKRWTGESPAVFRSAALIPVQPGD
jgi:AraC-like DNA-binding protein